MSVEAPLEDDAEARAELLVGAREDPHSHLSTVERAALVAAITADLRGEAGRRRRLLDLNQALEIDYQALRPTPNDLAGHALLIEKLRDQIAALKDHLARFPTAYYAGGRRRGDAAASNAGAHETEPRR